MKISEIEKFSPKDGLVFSTILCSTNGIDLCARMQLRRFTESGTRQKLIEIYENYERLEE